MLDTCQSTAGIDEIYSVLLKDNPTPAHLALVATSSRDGQGYAGRFTEVFDTKLRTYGDNEDHVSLSELLRRVSDELDGHDPSSHLHSTLTRQVTWPRAIQPRLIGTHSDVQELRLLIQNAPDVVQNHYYAKAASSPDALLDWNFTGRDSERRDIAAWLQDEHSGGMYVVTGLAGAGKSALLGMVLAATNADMRAALSGLGVTFTPDMVPGDVQFTSVLHLSNRSLAEVVSAIAEQEELDRATTVDELLAALAKSERLHLLLADALDESLNPLPIANLLRRIVAQAGCRVLVGTRRSLDETPDQSTPPNYALTDALRPDKTRPVEPDRQAFRDYISRRLGRGLADLPEDIRSRMAEEIATNSKTFLYARLAVEEVCADPDWVSRSLDGLLTTTHTGIFAHTVQRLRRTDPATEHLVHALAYAQGNGFPRTGRVWQTAGTAIAGEDLTDVHVETALRQAAAYISQDAEFGCEVYRLSHNSLRDYYRRGDLAMEPRATQTGVETS